MIRIDLGKDEDQQSNSSSSAFKNKFFKLDLPPALQEQLAKYTGDLSKVITIAVTIAIACLFPIFASQYQAVLEKQHQEVVKALNDRLAVLAGEVTKLTPFQRELQSYEEQKKVVTDRLTVVRQLLEQRNTPVNVLDTIGQSLPQKTWINGVEVVLNPDSSAISLNGTSFSNEEISDFIDKLAESIYLSDVTLESVSTRTEARIDLKSFTLSAKPKGTSLGPVAFGAPKP